MFGPAALVAVQQQRVLHRAASLRLDVAVEAGGLVVHHRPDLDRALLRAGDARRPRDRVVEVAAVEQVVAAELLARLGERAVAGDRLAVADPHRGRRGGGLEPLAAEHHAGLGGGAAERLVRGHDLARLLGRDVVPTGLVAVDGEQVLHGALRRSSQRPPRHVHPTDDRVRRKRQMWRVGATARPATAGARRSGASRRSPRGRSPAAGRGPARSAPATSSRSDLRHGTRRSSTSMPRRLRSSRATRPHGHSRFVGVLQR